MINEAARPIYLDNAATTAVDPVVLEAMRAVMLQEFGNPSSRHSMGLAAERQLRDARAELAAQLGVPPAQLTFTSGGTESLAIALLGTARARRRPGHLLVSALEHDAVQHTARIAGELGHEVELIPATPAGHVDPQRVAELLRPETFLVALMHVNNETGIVQPVEQVAGLVAAREGCRLLVDAVQSFAKRPTRLEALGADLLCLSAHKIHGPKGIGCLARRDRTHLAPLWGGGDQETGLRPGTENVPGAVGLARAAALWDGPKVAQRCAAFSAQIEAAVRAACPDAYALGDAERRQSNILAVAVPGARSEVLVNALSERGVLVSSGSACHGRKSLRSPVLQAMGIPADHGVIRVSFGRLTEAADVARAAEVLGETLPPLCRGGRRPGRKRSR